MIEKVDKILECTEKVMDVVPELYGDVVKPTAQESGKVISILPRTVNAALYPLRKWILEKEYSLAETEKILARKLERIDVKKIVTPDAYVAVPALQAISYSMDSEELRNAYANLLAKAMNVDSKGAVHPSFVEIIKQLSPTDAMVLKKIFEVNIMPIIDLCIENEKGENLNCKYSFSWISEFNYDVICIALDNLVRLGLIEIARGNHYTRDSNYDRVRATQAYINERKRLERQSLGKVVDKKTYIKKSSLGEKFYMVCIVD